MSIITERSIPSHYKNQKVILVASVMSSLYNCFDCWDSVIVVTACVIVVRMSCCERVMVGNV